MTTTSLLQYVEALLADIDPRDGAGFNRATSALADLRVRQYFSDLADHLRRLSASPTIDISDAVIEAACQDLRTLGYEPTVMQLAKVFIGSRSIVDRSLRAVTAYGRYRGQYTRPSIHRHLQEFQRRHPGMLLASPAANQRTVDEPWREVTFFAATNAFDKLDDSKATEIHRAVQALGLRKATERLPSYMAKARLNIPRAFEPWSREEQALLIEAMCYTNDAAKLADVFGRSAKSLTAMGKRLIYESQQRREVG